MRDERKEINKIQNPSKRIDDNKYNSNARCFMGCYLLKHSLSDIFSGIHLPHFSAIAAELKMSIQ